MFEKRVLRVFEKRVLRKIFGPKRDEVTVLELHFLYRSPNTIQVSRSGRMRWAGHQSTCEGRRGA